jgi:hypothetical protein
MTDDGLVAVTTATIEDVDAMKLSTSDRPIVLEALLRARLGGGTAAASITNQTGGGKQTIPPAADGDVLGKLASTLQLSRDTLELVYDIEDGVPTLVLSPKKIATNKSQAARQIGQLISAARQIGGVEEWTSANVIRKWTQEYGRLDGSNFAASLQGMESVAVLRGKGPDRQVKITKPGIESTIEMIKSMTGEA